MGGHGGVLAACMTGSVALHVAVLLSSAAGTPVTSGTGEGRSSGVQVRMAVATPRSSQATATPATVATPAVAPAQPVPSAADFDPNQLPPTGAGLQAHTDPAADPPADLEAAYLPRSLLTRPAAPQQSIDLLYPELAPSGRFRAVVTLFIDDRGVVQRVRIDEADDSGLPPVLEDATRQTFLRSAFTPGEIDGRPTRSRLRIEVEYATEPLHGGTPPAAH
jgi:hypothetical protein